MSAERVLRYLADLAPEAASSGLVHVRRKSDLLMLSSLTARPRRERYQPRNLVFPVEADAKREDLAATTMANTHAARREEMFPLRFFYADEGVDRFEKIDALSPDERLLRLGFLWLAGVVRTEDAGDLRFLLPIMSASVTAQSRLLTENEFELLTDFEFESALGTAEQWDELEGAAFGLLLDVHVDGHPRADRRVQAFAGKLGRQLGLPSPVVVDRGDHPHRYRRAEGLHLSAGMGVYLARDVTEVTLGATLKSWLNSDLRGTAFEAMYGAPEPGEVDPGGRVEAPVHLNARQRQAVLSARIRPVSVISGPPGTGKTHTVAAMALDGVARGETVLVATQSDHAAEVVTKHLDRMHASGFIRFGRTGDRTSAAEYLSGGISEIRGAELREATERLDHARARLDETLAILRARLEQEDQVVRSLIDRIRYPAVREAFPGLPEIDLTRAQAVFARHGDGAGWRARFAMWRLLRALGSGSEVDRTALERALAIEDAERVARRLFEGPSDTATLWEQAGGQAEAVRVLYGEFVEMEVMHRAHGKRREVAALASALRSGRAVRRRILRDTDLAGALEALPLWIGTLSEIDDTLPAAPRVFDVVILDEASQIDQIRAATALARAKRAVVVGDPRQLRHVSFTSDAAMERAAELHGVGGPLRRVVDVRRNSLFDAAASAAGVVVLEEHFRSVPHVIEFSNREFYDGQLRLMTQHPRNESSDVIDVVRVDGHRADDGVNATEVEAAVELIRSIEKATVALVSPFRAQADALEEAMVSSFSAEEIRHRGLKVGTVHAMQGAERDLLIISLAIDADSLRSRRFIEDQHLFNTMITRARTRVLVLTSFDESGLGDGLLAEYLQYSHEPPAPSWDGALPAGWVGEIGGRLRSYGLRVIPGYPVAGWTVDLAVGTGPEAVGVICGVHPGGVDVHIERQSALRRAGWELVDAFESVHLAYPERAVGQVVERVLARMPGRGS